MASRSLAARSLTATLCCLASAACPQAVPADHPAPVERVGRWLGVGWGDGYHVCRDGGIRPGADLPPVGYPHQFGPKPPSAPCGPVYPPGTAMPRQTHSATTPGTCDRLPCDTSSSDESTMEYQAGDQPAGHELSQTTVPYPIPRSDSSMLNRPQSFIAEAPNKSDAPTWLDTHDAVTASDVTIDPSQRDLIQSRPTGMALPIDLPTEESSAMQIQSPDLESLFSHSELLSAMLSPADDRPIQTLSPGVRFLPKVLQTTPQQSPQLDTPAKTPVKTVVLEPNSLQVKDIGVPNPFFGESMPTPIDIRSRDIRAVAGSMTQRNPYFPLNDRAPQVAGASAVRNDVSPRVADARVGDPRLGWNPVLQPD